MGEFWQIYMRMILENYSLPKCQVEKHIELLLKPFIAGFLNSVFGKGTNYIVEESVFMEYPLKKEGNNQSRTVDFLAVSPTKIYFLELKTASSSFRSKQVEFYLKLQEEIRLKGAGFLLSDLYEIRKVSDKFDKYNQLINNIEKKCSFNLNQIQDAEVVYIGPEKLRSTLRKYPDVKYFSFTDLSQQRVSFSNEKYLEFWNVMVYYLKFIDVLDKSVDVSVDELISAEKNGLLDDINQYKPIIKSLRQKREYWEDASEIRISKASRFPNYQVYYKNGKAPVAFNGRTHEPYKVKGKPILFDEKKLKEPVSIKLIQAVFPET